MHFALLWSVCCLPPFTVYKMRYGKTKKEKEWETAFAETICRFRPTVVLSAIYNREHAKYRNACDPHSATS